MFTVYFSITENDECLPSYLFILYMHTQIRVLCKSLRIQFNFSSVYIFLIGIYLFIFVLCKYKRNPVFVYSTICISQQGSMAFASGLWWINLEGKMRWKKREREKKTYVSYMNYYFSHYVIQERWCSEIRSSTKLEQIYREKKNRKIQESDATHNRRILTYYWHIYLIKMFLYIYNIYRVENININVPENLQPSQLDSKTVIKANSLYFFQSSKGRFIHITTVAPKTRFRQPYLFI